MAATKKGRSRTRPAAEESTGSEIEGTLKGIRSKFGDNAAVKGSAIHQPERISTGSFMLDFATLGGVPHNRITMLIGERHSGKSTMSLKIAGNAQRQYPNQRVVFVDIEGTFDAVWAEKNGIDTDELILLQPETGEAAADMIDAMIRTKEVSLVVVDSVAALVPMREVEGSAEDAHVGLQARLVGGMIRKATAGLIAERNRGHLVTILLVNQFRVKIGGYSPHGEARSVPGGKALEFSTSLQVIMKNREMMGKDGFDVETVGVNEHSFDIKKNKMCSGPRQGEFRLLRVADESLGLAEASIDDAPTMLAYAKKFGYYTGGGSSWTLEVGDDVRKVRGLAEAVKALYDPEDDLYQRLRNLLIRTQAEHLGMPPEFLARFE
jgi:recombination protein RecA